MPEGIDLALPGDHGARDRDGALGRDDDRRVVGGKSSLDEGAHLVEIERPLRDENDVGSPRHAAVQGDPPGMAAHDLNDQHPVMAFRGGVQPVNRLRGDVDRGVETEGVVRRGEVVVDSLGHSDHGQSLGVQLGGHPQGVLPADRDERVHRGGGEVLAHQRGPVHGGVGIRAAGAEDRAAAREDPPHGRDVQRDRLAGQRPPPAVPVPDEAVAVDALSLAHDGPDHRVESRAVAATGQYADPHPEFSRRPYTAFSGGSVAGGPYFRTTLWLRGVATIGRRGRVIDSSGWVTHRDGSETAAAWARSGARTRHRARLCKASASASWALGGGAGRTGRPTSSHS